MGKYIITVYKTNNIEKIDGLKEEFELQKIEYHQEIKTFPAIIDKLAGIGINILISGLVWDATKFSMCKILEKLKNSNYVYDLNKEALKLVIFEDLFHNIEDIYLMDKIEYCGPMKISLDNNSKNFIGEIFYQMFIVIPRKDKDISVTYWYYVNEKGEIVLKGESQTYNKKVLSLKKYSLG